jgi:hypothetical protein
MTLLQQIKRRADSLPEPDRAALAAHLLVSLPPVLSDHDDGIEEALRRSAELDSDPGAGISVAEFVASVIGVRRR